MKQTKVWVPSSPSKTKTPLKGTICGGEAGGCPRAAGIPLALMEHLSSCRAVPCRCTLLSPASTSSPASWRSAAGSRCTKPSRRYPALPPTWPQGGLGQGVLPCGVRCSEAGATGGMRCLWSGINPTSSLLGLAARAQQRSGLCCQSSVGIGALLCSSGFSHPLGSSSVVVAAWEEVFDDRAALPCTS